jgi:hypothetical protein
MTIDLVVVIVGLALTCPLGDEDIPTHDDSPIAIQGPIIRARACQLQYQVKSFLSSTPCQLQDRLLSNEILIVRNEGQAYD